MTSMFRSGSSRRKAEAPGKIRIQIKGKNSKVINNDDEDDPEVENVDGIDDEYDDDGDNLPVTFDNGIPDDLPEGTCVVQPEAVEDSPVKKKREVRIDTSVLDSVSCTACGRQLNPYKGGALQKHPELKVVICKRCEKFLASGEIAKDKDGTDEQCRWCGEGGRLVVCDECASAFCKACVMRNFNRSEFNNINSQQNWKCYLCNKAPLQGLRDNYRKIRDTLKALHVKDEAKTQAANPTSNGTQPSEKSTGSKQVSKGGPAFGMQGGKVSGAVSAQNFLPPVGMTAPILKTKSESPHKLPSVGLENIMLSSKDINVNSENVFPIIDQLIVATNTFREVLHVLQSQCQFSATGYLNIQALGLQCASALHMGVETYLKSLKTILSAPPFICESESLLAGTHYRHQASGIDPISSIVTPEAFASSRLPERPVMMPMGTNFSVHSNEDINSFLSQQCSSSSSSSTAGHMPEVNKSFAIDIIRESSKSVKQDNRCLVEREKLCTFSLEQSGSDFEKAANSLQVPKDKDTNSVISGAEVTAESKHSTRNTAVSRNEEERSKTKNNKDIKNEKDSKESSRLNSRQNTRIDSLKGNTKQKGPGQDGEAQAEGNDSQKTERINPVFSQKLKQETEEMGLPDGSSVKCKEEKTSCDVAADESIAAKFDLINELAEEMLRDNRDEDKDIGSCKVGSDDKDDKVKLSSTTSKRKKSQILSDSGAALKKCKGMNNQEAAESSEDVADDISKNTNIQEGKAPKLEESRDDSTADGDVSDSQPISDDDVDLATRKKKKEMLRHSEKTLKPAFGKKENVNTDEKLKTNGKSSDLKRNDRGAGTDACSKELAKRKRKATSSVDEESLEEKMNNDSKGSQNNVKKAKPGSKSSKQDMSSVLPLDGNGKKATEESASDDEDEPPVTFYLNAAEVEDQKDHSEDECSVEKDGSHADKEDENDHGLLDSEHSGGVKKKKMIKKMKKGKSSKDESDIDDMDECEGNSKINGKRKKMPHPAKSSESESDSDKTKRKKKDKDEDGDFKLEESSSSSIESDLSDSDNAAEESDDSAEQEEDGESKSKKKGKKKTNKKKKRKGKDKKESEDENDDEGEEEEEEDEEEDDEGEKKKKGKEKKKAKKIDSSDEEDEAEEKEEDDDDPNSSKAGKRKQIRKVMSNKKLEDSTKAAAKAEEKRRKRIAAKQREFNIETITDENNPMNCPVTTKLVLEPGKEEGDEPLIQVNKNLVRKLKPHQVEAVQFMWDCMYESVKRSKKEQGSGCILAHCMGLGKTLSVVAYVHTVLSHESVLKHRTCLVVSPLNTVLNWRNEWGMWLDEEDQLEVWELASCKQNAARAEALKEWQANGGVMIMGYEMYRNLTTGSRCKNKRQKKVFQDTLVDPGPDLVVCDEGHILKNEASAISKAMNQMKTRRRVVLTGTPLQNNLNEYHCMVSFVKPNLLGTRKEFTNRFINPIQNGQCTDSTLRDVRIMKARAHVLHEMLAGCVQRRDYSALTKFLPPKQEYVISVRLTDIQVELYEKYLEMTGQGLDGVFSNKGARLFTDYQNLMKIWTHPWVLKLAEIRDEMKMKFDDDDSFIDDDSDEDRSFSSSGSSSEDDKAVSDSSGKAASSRINMQRGTRRTRAKARRQAGEDSDPEEVIAEWKSKTRASKGNEDGDIKTEEPDKFVTKEWWAQYVTEDDKLKLELSNKLHLLFEILRMCEEIGDKVLIFSQSILSLNIIESFLEVVDSKFQQECESLTEEEKEKEVFGRSWTKNLDYYRMDGSTSAQNRQLWASNFNDLENYRARLFLISTRAGGLGINLVAANRVIIFDASWNPSHDVQSIFRVYRFGQTKPCYIYRFLAQGTMEEKIYERQVTKLSLSQRVVDEHQIERHFSANDLKELYNFRPDRWDDGTEKPTLALPKDPLLAEILTANRHCVVSFHEHDSLLENQVEQTLTEEEKKAAWEEYENEKKGIIIRGPGMERAASWPMMAAAQILSREQITATVQALRQQLPDISEDLFHLHVQQALRRQVQIKQEEMRRMELLRLQEMNYLNMIKQHAQQSGLSHAQSLQAMQSMAPWMQIQRLRAMQQSMLMGGGHMGMLPQASMSLLGQALSNPISNKPEEAIDLDDN